MATFTDVFGTDTVPPSEFGYQLLTITTNTTLVWPYNSQGGTSVAKITEISASAGVTVTFPAANEVSIGEDFLLRNVGSESVTIKDAGGATLATLAAGAADYFYVTDNTSAAGDWGLIYYGVGSSSVDAGTLVGYGLKAISTTLNQAHEVSTSATAPTIDSTYRAKVFVYTGGAATLALDSAVTLGADFFFILRNNGTGTLTINPSGAETIDDLATFDVQPGESMLIFCTGTGWYSAGYGRSVVYNFTQLVKDLSAYSGGSVTLSSTEASNKLLTFTGNPASAVTVIVPNTVAVYYVLSSLSTAVAITLKTAAGLGVSIPQSQRVITICDSTNVYSAQSAAASSALSMLDGTSSAPALNFASQTNTGFFKYSSLGLGISSNGSEIAHFDASTGSKITGALEVTGHVTLESVTSTGATGTGKLVFDTSPSFTTPSLGVATATSVNGTSVPSSKTLLVTTDIGVSVQGYSANLGTWSGITPGTGVATALAINVGTAGSFITNGGALGTPSSGTLTNATGLPVGGITQNTGKLLGRYSAGSGVTQEITISTGLSLDGSGNLTASSSGITTGKAIAMAMIFS